MKKEHPLYKGYYVTPCGEIYGRHGRLKKQTINRDGYKTVGIMVDQEDGSVKQKCVLSHRMVAETYILNPDNLPTVNHINEDKLDNRIENLEWMTFTDNKVYSKALVWTIEEVSTGRRFKVTNLNQFCKEHNYPYSTLRDSNIPRRWNNIKHTYKVVDKEKQSHRH